MARVVVDVEQLMALKGVFDQQSAEIAGVVSSVGGHLQATEWEGPAAEQMRSQWTEQFEPVLRNLESALQQASADIDRRAQNYLANG